MRSMTNDLKRRSVFYEELDHFRRLIEFHPFRFAKTMPAHPHFYTLRREWQDVEFDYAVAFIRANGYAETWGGRTYRYLNLNGWRYWTMGAPLRETILINRAEVRYPNIYDEVAEVYDDRFSDPDSLAENEEVMTLVGDLQGKRVLDIGAGTGLLLDYVHSDLPPENYVGIEPSVGMRNQLLHKHPEYADSVVLTPFEDFANGTFDVVLSLFGSVSYIPHEYLSRLKSMQRTGGRRLLMFFKDGYNPVSCVGTSNPSNHFEGGWRFLEGESWELNNHVVLT